MRISTLQLSALAFFLAHSCACASAPARIDAAPEWNALALDLTRSIEYEMADKQLPCLAIALVDGQRIVWAQGFGVAHADTGRRTSSQTLWRVASVSKLFTDIGIMQLVERGELDLDVPVRAELPNFVRGDVRAGEITLRQLASHRSGLVREPPVGHYFDDTRPSLADTVGSLQRTRLIYEPGTRTKYSNAGVATIGRVLEAKVGEPFAGYLQREVLVPLGMTTATFIRTPEVERTLAGGIMWGYDGREFAAPDIRLGMAPASDMYASVEDLGRFMKAIFAGGLGSKRRVIAEETLAQMMEPARDEQGQRLRYGIGFAVGELQGRKVCGHGGAIYGYATQVSFLPEEGLGVIVVAGVDGANTVTSRLAKRALEGMLAQRGGQDLPAYERFEALDEELAREVVGTYLAAEGRIELIEREGQLKARWGTELVSVRASGADLVLDGRLGRGPRLALERNAVGKVSGLRIGDVPYERTELSAPAACRQEWRDLIGEYGWDHNVLFILEEGGHLTALIEWFWYEHLKPMPDGRFAFSKTRGLYHGEALEFRRDAAGRVTGVALGELVFPRRGDAMEEGETFTIEPVKPVADLRATALAASPPKESGDKSGSQLVDVLQVDPQLHLDIRYASTNNFMGSPFYQQARAFMQQPAAEALARAHQRLLDQGYGILIHDAYRPWHVTRMFWDGVPEQYRDFVADPTRGSRHNRGCAVDLTLCDPMTGTAIPMVSGYDEFEALAGPAYPGGTSRQRWHRELLRAAMEAEGFSVYRNEWWHFDFDGWERYPILNLTFEELTEGAVR